MELEEIQQQFARVLLKQAKTDDIADLVSPKESVERWALYRGNLLAHWSNALRNAYPVMEQLVGADYFSQLAYEFGQAYPCQQPDLNQFGQEFSLFLQQHAVAIDYPYFADVAKLEWALHSSYYAQDAASLSLARLGTLAGHGWEAVRLHPNPASRLISSAWAVHAIWLAHQKIGEPDIVTDLQQYHDVLVYRKEWKPQLRLLSGAESLALEALFAGRSLALALELAMSENSAFDVAAALSTWINEEIFCQASLINKT